MAARRGQRAADTRTAAHHTHAHTHTHTHTRATSSSRHAVAARRRARLGAASAPLALAQPHSTYTHTRHVLVRPRRINRSAPDCQLVFLWVLPQRAPREPMPWLPGNAAPPTLYTRTQVLSCCCSSRPTHHPPWQPPLPASNAVACQAFAGAAPPALHTGQAAPQCVLLHNCCTSAPKHPPPQNTHTHTQSWHEWTAATKHAVRPAELPNHHHAENEGAAAQHAWPCTCVTASERAHARTRWRACVRRMRARQAVRHTTRALSAGDAAAPARRTPHQTHKHPAHTAACHGKCLDSVQPRCCCRRRCRC
jgi:hypothetical protein